MIRSRSRAGSPPPARAGSTSSTSTARVPDGANVYFVHSYFAKPLDDGVIASAAEYPDPFAAVVWRDNVMATQFHPEKSQQVGLRILDNFVRQLGGGAA